MKHEECYRKAYELEAILEGAIEEGKTNEGARTNLQHVKRMLYQYFDKIEELLRTPLPQPVYKPPPQPKIFARSWMHQSEFFRNGLKAAVASGQVARGARLNNMPAVEASCQAPGPDIPGRIQTENPAGPADDVINLNKLRRETDVYPKYENR